MFQSKNSKYVNELRPASLVVLKANKTPIAEEYRMLKANLLFATKNQAFKSMLVTSSVSGEGKSTTAANLAVTFAESGKRVLLIDADMRRPTVDKTFQLGVFEGLNEWLSREVSELDEIIQRSGVPNLDIIPSGFTSSDPSALIASLRMDRLIRRLKLKYDLIIFDTPPLNLVPDAQILSAKVDGALLVVRKGVTKKPQFLQAKDLLNRANANILGVVYKTDEKKEKDYGYYHSYRQRRY